MAERLEKRNPLGILYLSIAVITDADVRARSIGPIVNDDESYQEIDVFKTRRIGKNRREHEIRTQGPRHR